MANNFCLEKGRPIALLITVWSDDTGLDVAQF